MTATQTGRAAPGRDRSGRRAQRLARERRRRVRRRLAFLGGGLAIAALAATVTVLVAMRVGDPQALPRGGVGDTVGPPQETLLFVTHAGEGRPAQSVTLFASRADDPQGLVLFLPVGALVELPGVGLDRLGLAYQYGGLELVRSTVEHALGVRIDHAAGVNDAGFASWIDRVGGLQVDVPARLVQRRADGSADVRFEAGPQQLEGARVAELWNFRAQGEEELSIFPRQQRVAEALLDAMADDERRGALLEGGPPQWETDGEVAWLDGLFAGLATAREAQQTRITVLPVEPFGGEGPDGRSTYRIRDAEVRELVASRLSGAVPIGGGAEAIRVQVLNGVGLPGIGQEVDRRLDRGRFRIVLSDNARHFEFETTQIVVYEESDRALEAARRVQEVLGVGTIQLSRQPQSVVDLTIVVGADFAREAGIGVEQDDDSETG